MVTNFSPIDISDARLHRRLLMRTMSLVGTLTRHLWQHSSAARSTWHERTTLWQAIWTINRRIGCLPRTQSYEIEMQMSRRIRMRLDLARLNDAFVFCFGAGESEIGYLCSLFCESDSVVLDVGANIGSTALAFAEIVPLGEVHAFEPSVAMCDVLRSNIALSGFKNIVVHPFGLSDSPAWGKLQLAMAGNPGSAYCSLTSSEEIGTDRVELCALDEVIDPSKQIDFVKIDVEGFEYRVLLGGRRLVLRHKPALVIEVNEPALKRASTSAGQLFNLPDEWGYRLLYLVRGRFLDYVPANHSNQGINSVLAVHPDSNRAWRIVQEHRRLSNE